MEIVRKSRAQAKRPRRAPVTDAPVAPNGFGGDHFVQFYEDTAFLVRSVAEFIGGGIGAGQGAIVIAAASNLKAIDEQLSLHGIDVNAVKKRGQYVALDAAETLSTFMVNGAPDAALFKKVVGGVVESVGRHRAGVRAFGEMVSLLWSARNGAAATQLEELWNELGKEHAFDLFCAYPLKGFSKAVDGRPFQQICLAHGRVLPTENFARKDDAARLREVAALQQKAAALEVEVAERERIQKALELASRIPAENPAPVMRVGRDQTIHFANPRAQKFLAQWLVRVGDRAPAIILDLIARGDAHTAEIQVDSRWFTAAVAPARDGEYTNLYFTDITDRKRAEDALHASEARYRQLVSLMPAGIYSCDATGRITFYNRRAAELWGREPDLHGSERFCACYKVFGPDGTIVPPEQTPMAVALREGKTFRNVEGLVERPDGSRFVASVNIDPVRDENGDVCGAINVFQDISDRKQTTEALRQSEERFRLATRAGTVGVWDWDVTTNKVSWSDSVFAIHGLKPNEFAGTVEAFGALVHPDDQARIQEALQRALRDGAPYEVEFRSTRPDGKVIWIYTTAQIIRDASGAPLRMLGSTVDITRRKEVEAALRESEQRHRQLLSLMPSAVYTCDRDGRITFYNRRAAELWGREPGLNDDDQKFCGALKLWLPDGAELPHAQTPMAVAVRDGVPCRDREVVIERLDGSRVTVNVNIDPLFDDEGRPCGAINVFQDITARVRAEETLHRHQAQLEAELADTQRLQEISATLIQEDNAELLYGKILEAAISMLGADMGCMQMADEQEDALRILACRGLSPDFSKAFDFCRPDARTCCNLARENGERVIVPDVEASGFFAGTEALAEFQKMGVRAVQSTPLVSRNGRLVGMISTHWRRTHQPTERDLRLLDIVARQAADAIERRHAEMLLGKSKSLLEGQKDAFQAAMKGCSLEESLHVLVRLAIGFTGGRARAAFFLTRPDGNTLRHVVGMTKEYAFDVDGFLIGADSLACGLAMHLRQPIITPDVETEPRWEPWRWMARKHDYRACWSFPVHTNDGPVFGTFAMYFREPYAPTPSEMELGTVIAHAATLIISRHQQSSERKQAEDALRKRNERLELLSQTLGQLLSAGDPETIVRELFPKVAAHLGVDTYFNFMVNPAGDALALHSCVGIPEETARSIGRLEFGQAICGTVAQTRQAIHATNIQNSDYDKAALVRGFGIQAYACNPLMVGDRLLGTLSFASRTRTAFDQDELQFLKIISQYAAVALDRLRQSEKLRDSEERFRAVLDNSTAVIYVKDCDGRYLLMNKQYARVCQLAPEQFIGKTDSELFPAEIAQQFRQHDLEVIRTGEAIEIEETAPHQDGPHTYLSVKFPLRRADGAIYAVAGISTDISDRKRAQLAMQRLACIVESSDDAIISKDLNGIITSWNKGAERVFGYTAEEVTGKPGTLLMPPERVNEEPGILERIRRGEPVEHYQTVRRRKDGALLDISLTVSPIKDADGNVIGTSKVARDITELVRAKEKLEQTVAERTAQLRDTVAELEAFSYSVAHDMRAPLRAMNSYSRFLQDDFASLLPPEGKDFARRIAASAQRLDTLITDVLNYSKIARAEMPLEKVDVEKLTREIVDSYPNLRESGATILVESGVPPVIGNTAALTQCISNLLTNAIKFVAPDRKPRVVVRAERNGGVVRLWFEDNGIGISQAGQERIFRLFQRLHPAKDFEGTGIGLTIVRKAVERMGGRVGVQSTQGEGSQFWIELKAA